MFDRNIDQLYENYLKGQESRRKELLHAQTVSGIHPSLFMGYSAKNGSATVEIVTDNVARYRLLVNNKLVKSTVTVGEMNEFIWKDVHGEIEEDLTFNEFKLRMKSLIKSFKEDK